MAEIQFKEAENYLREYYLKVAILLKVVQKGAVDKMGKEPVSFPILSFFRF